MLELRARLNTFLAILDKSYRRVLNRVLAPILADRRNAISRQQKLAVDILVSFLSIIVATWIVGIIAHNITKANYALLYLVPIILIAIRYGRLAAVLSAILATLADDFFFIEPRHMLNVASFADVVSLIFLSIVGFVIGQLVAALRDLHHTTVASETRIRTLFAFSQEIAAAPTNARMAEAVAHRILSTFAPAGMHVCALMTADLAGELKLDAVQHDHTRAGRDLALDSALSVGYAGQALASASVEAHRLRNAPDVLTAYAPLRSGGKAVGVLIAVLSNDAVALLLKTIGERRYSLAMPGGDPNASAQAVLFAAMRDQTALELERRQLHEVALQAATLRESNRAKDAFLGSITHELQTPIAVILSAITSLQLDGEWEAEDRANLLEDARQGALRLKNMVSNTLSYTKLEAGAMTFSQTWYPINDVVATAVRQLSLAGVIQPGQARIRIETDPLEALMDHMQIERVMINLIENAAKYSPPGESIEISAEHVGEMLEVRVHDHGIGIPPDALQAIFEPFRRLNAPVPGQEFTVPPGSGLGLAICAGIVREHGGEIHAESQVGQGTTIIFTLPWAAKDRTRYARYDATGAIPQEYGTGAGD